MPEVTVELLKQIADAFNRHDTDAIMDFFAEDGVMETPRGKNPWGERLTGKEDRFDRSHLNAEGARIFSRLLVQDLAGRIDSR